MEKNKIVRLVIPAILQSYRPRVDGSFSIGLSTLMLNKEQREAVHDLFQQSCYVMIKDSEISREEIEEMDSVEMDLEDPKKTPSRRLRSVLYLEWEQKYQDHVTFKEFYKIEMEKLIEVRKQRLE